jgi:type IV secretory pathway VirB2 component (pilin)
MKPFITLLAVIASTIPETSFAAPWDSVGQQILTDLTGPFAKTIAAIAVVACGIAAMAGRMPVDWAIKIVLGIVLIFGSTSFVTWISSAVS